VELSPGGSLGKEELQGAVLQPALRTAERDMGPLKAQGPASAPALPQCPSQGMGDAGFEAVGAKMTVLRGI